MSHPVPSRFLVPSVILAAVVVTSVAQADVFYRKLTLEGAQEVPPVATAATGSGTVVINTATNTYTYNITYSGLSSNENNAHIHGMAARGASAGPLVTLPAGSGTSGSKSGVWTYAEGQEADILAGRTYINVHTVNNGGGEIRAQVDIADVPGTGPLGVWALLALLGGAGVVLLMRRPARNPAS